MLSLSWQHSKVPKSCCHARFVPCRLKQLDEANGHNAQAGIDEQTDNGLMSERTGHVHSATKQSIVRQWLDGADDQAVPSGTCMLLYDASDQKGNVITTASCHVGKRRLHKGNTSPYLRKATP